MLCCGLIISLVWTLLTKWKLRLYVPKALWVTPIYLLLVRKQAFRDTLIHWKYHGTASPEWTGWRLHEKWFLSSSRRVWVLLPLLPSRSLVWPRHSTRSLRGNSPIKFGMIDGITGETRQEAKYQGFFPSLHEMLVWLAMIQPPMPLFEGVKDRERWKWHGHELLSKDFRVSWPQSVFKTCDCNCLHILRRMERMKGIGRIWRAI